LRFFSGATAPIGPLPPDSAWASGHILLRHAVAGARTIPRQLLASPQWLVQSRCEGSASCDCGPPLPRPRRWLEKSSTGSVVRSTKAESMAALSGSLRYDGRIGENSRRHRLIGAAPSGKQEALMPAAMEGKPAIQGRTRTLFRRNVSLKRCRNRYFRMPN